MSNLFTWSPNNHHDPLLEWAEKHSGLGIPCWEKQIWRPSKHFTLKSTLAWRRPHYFRHLATVLCQVGSLSSNQISDISLQSTPAIMEIRHFFRSWHHHFSLSWQWECKIYFNNNYLKLLHYLSFCWIYEFLCSKFKIIWNKNTHYPYNAQVFLRNCSCTLRLWTRIIFRTITQTPKGVEISEVNCKLPHILNWIFLPVEVSFLCVRMILAWNHLHHLKMTENDDQPWYKKKDRKKEQLVNYDSH